MRGAGVEYSVHTTVKLPLHVFEAEPQQQRTRPFAERYRVLHRGTVLQKLDEDGCGGSIVALRKGCSQLKAAMMGGYRFHPKNGSIDKNKHSHVAEALQYLMLHIGTAGGGEVLARRREIKKVASGGWT